MSIPDFDRAEYREPTVIDGSTGYNAPGYIDVPQRVPMAALPVAVVYGAVAAVVGAGVYAAVSMTGFMVSIISIGIGYVVARAMMTATRGLGGRPYQIAAVALTYFSCTLGSLAGALLRQHVSLLALFHPGNFVQIATYVLVGPFLEFTGNMFWAAMGLLILFYGLRTAWQMAAGTPGFGQPGGPRMTVMGLWR